MTAIDRYLPAWEFRERHEVVVRATVAGAERAARSVTVAELPVARALLALRGLPAWARGRRRGGDPRDAVLDAMRRGGFVVLSEAPGELVLGLAGDFVRLTADTGGTPRSADAFVAFDRAGWCKAVIDFRAVPQGDGCLLSTETRVHAADAATRRRFGRYWRVIRPFSGLIRIVFLRAARRRAEAA